VGAPIGPWLNRILVNLAIDRSRSRRDEVDLADVEGRWRDDLDDALAYLPAGYRAVVVLHDAAGMTTPVIADADDPKRVAGLAQPMRCWKARSQISAYLDDELPAEGRHAVEEHLADCPTCLQETLGEMQDTDKVVPEEIAARIAAALAARSGEG